MRSALIVVDVQNDFCIGSLAVPGAPEIVPVINSLMERFDVIVASKDWHPEKHICFITQHSDKNIGDVITVDGIDQLIWPVHCVQNKEGGRFYKSLNKEKINQVIYKGTNKMVDSYSAFRDNKKESFNGLHSYLQNKGVTKIYITGLATDYCVKFTALGGVELGYETFLIKDAVRGVNLSSGDSARAIEEMKNAGVKIISSKEC